MVRVVVFQGPSGAGKTTLQKKLRIPKIVTWTTRPPRVDERDGIDYHFIDIQTFEYMRRNDRMLEFTEYKSNFYGTTLDSIISNDGITRSVVLDVRGAQRVKEFLRNECLVIGVYADEKDCYSRLTARSESTEALAHRLRDYDVEISQLLECDIVLNNSTKNWNMVAAVLDWIRIGLNI